MRIYGLIVSTALIGMALMLHGQDAAPPSVDLYEGQEQFEPPPSPLPPNGAELPAISQLDQTFSKPSSLGNEAVAARGHIEWRQLTNGTVNEPQVQAAKAYEEAAGT